MPQGPIEPKVNFKHQQIIEDFSLKNKITRYINKILNKSVTKSLLKDKYMLR